MDSSTLFDAKEYWNDIKIFIIPRMREEVVDERVEYLIRQIEISLDTNDTSMFDFDIDEELNQKNKLLLWIGKRKKVQ